MIQKARIGRGFRGVLTYVFAESAERGHDRARIVDSNMAGETPRELAAEFGVFRRLNPDLTRAVYHCSLRLSAEEWLPQADWREFCRDYLAAMGFGASPYVVVQHADDHVHIVASRVQFDGRTVPDSNDRWRSNRVIHALEEKHDLAHARDPERARARQPQVSRDEVALAARVGEVPPKFVLAARIDAAVAHSDGTRAGFDAVLDTLGVTAHWNIARTGRIHGASYELRDYQGAMGAVCKGSQVGKGYGWGRLAERLEERRGEHAREGRTGGTDARSANDAAGGGVPGTRDLGGGAVSRGGPVTDRRDGAARRGADVSDGGRGDADGGDACRQLGAGGAYGGAGGRLSGADGGDGTGDPGRGGGATGDARAG